MLNYLLDLQRFAEGGEAGAIPGGEPAQGVTDSPSDEGAQQSPPAPEIDRQEQYKKFKEDFKAEYDAEVQSVIKDRLSKSKAQNKELNNRLNAMRPLLERFSQKYGVAADDIDGIMAAFDADDANYEEEAYERGMTVEQVKQFHQIERENRALKIAEEERQRAELFARWDAEAAALKTIYPNFDMSVEMENPEFRKLMNAQVPIRTAYEVAHHNELIAGAQQFAVQQANEKLTNAVAANKSRPTENGLSSQSAAVVKTDINSLSRDQIEDIKRRAAAGEKINFR